MIKSLSLAGACLLLFLSACASAVSGAWKPDTPAVGMTPQAIMSGKTCTDLPVDHTPNINPGKGWTKMPAAKMSCGSKYASGVYVCQVPAECGPLVYGTYPNDPKDRGKEWHLIVDGVGGDFEACAEPANRFGVRGSIDCKHVKFSGVSRAVLPATVPPLYPGATEQTATTLQVTIWPTGTEPVTIGQIGPAESPAS